MAALTSCENALLLFSCHPIGRLCVGGPRYSGRTANVAHCLCKLLCPFPKLFNQLGRSLINILPIHDFHNGGPLGWSGNEPHQSEASKATIFISESSRVVACRIVLVSLA